MSICLLTTLHDPDGKLVKSANKYFQPISRLYDEYAVEVTDSTIYSGLIHKPYFSPAGNIGESRRNCLRHGLDTDCTHFHFVDFDRLLYWYMNYLEELKQVIRLIQCDKFTIIGRTQAAFDSHPWYQRETENLINRQFNQNFGETIDLLAASRGMNRTVADWIAKSSKASNPACIDCEWPIIAKEFGDTQYLKVNGLSYESNLLNIERDWPDEVKIRTQHLAEVVKMLYG